MSFVFYLSCPGMISSLGSGVQSSMKTLLDATVNPLTLSDRWVRGKDLYFGEVDDELLPELAADTPVQFHSRNNRLLAAALMQVDAAIDQAATRYGSNRVAVVMGTSTTAADENAAATRQCVHGARWEDVSFLHAHQQMSNPADFTAWRYELSSLVYGISTACTSSARALISAARLLRLGVCDAVICGGVDTLSLLTINGFHSLEVLSDGIANPFSHHRNGINIGEAAAVFVMTRERNSEEDLLFHAYGASSDAYHMSSPHPAGEGAQAAITAALQAGNFDATDIGWVNLHGTGTGQNDAMESLAVHTVLGDTVPCASTKPLSGHTLGAAGALEAAIVWGTVSRTVNSDGKLPMHRWDGVRDKALPLIWFGDADAVWAEDRPRIGLSASYAFGGNNAVLIIGEAL